MIFAFLPHEQSIVSSNAISNVKHSLVPFIAIKDASDSVKLEYKGTSFFDNSIRTRKIIYFFNSPFNSFHCCPIKLSQISGTAVELLKIKPIAWKNLITIGNSQEKAYWSVKTSWHKICRCPTTILVNILCFNGYMQIEPFIGIGSFKTI